MRGKMAAGVLGGIMVGAAAATALWAQAPAPKGYLIGQVNITNAEAYARDYAPKVQGALAPFGGRYLVRGGSTVTLEGDPPSGRVVVIEFPSVEAARGFWSSPAYQALAPIRRRHSTGESFIVAGIAPAS